MPERIIESLDLNKAVSCLGIDGEEASWSGFDEYHRAVLQHLEVCGAEVAVIASNTTHHRLRKIVGGIGIPVLSILEAAATQCVQIEARPVLILGTALTMTSLKFRPAFADLEFKLSVRMRITQLQAGKLQGAAERLGSIASSAFNAQFTEPPVVCRACTELPLALGAQETLATFEYDGIL